MAVFHLNNIWYCDEKNTYRFPESRSSTVSQSSEYKPKPRRTHYLTPLLASGRFYVCFFSDLRRSHM